jgi:uncharacterized protein (DUF433 family)
MTEEVKMVSSWHRTSCDRCGCDFDFTRSEPKPEPEEYVCSSCVDAEKYYCDGWENGYKSGKADAMREVAAAQQAAVIEKVEPCIRKTPGVCGGRACIRKTRMPVWLLFRMWNKKLTDQEILKSYSDTLTQEDLDEARSYIADNFKEILQDCLANEP